MTDKESLISIEGLNKADVLAALYNGARAQGAGFLRYTPEPMDSKQAAEILKEGSSFDYLNGRVLKVNLSGDQIDPWGYDRDNGNGAAATVVNILRMTLNTNSEEIERLHLEGTRSAAEIVENHLGEKDQLSSENGILTLSLGLQGFADKLRPIVGKILDDSEDPELDK